MCKYDKIYIYFDTNSLELRHANSALFLSELVIAKEYYELERIIVDWELNDQVKICIPEIVWLEIKKHMKDFFKSTKQCMETKIQEYKKTFGSLAEITYEFKEASLNYENYLEEITDNFLSNPQVSAEIINCPKDINTISRVINNAMYTIPPFAKVKKGSKEYTDAGLKDALIYETILYNTKDNLGILISNDNDFYELFKNAPSNLLLCKSVHEVQQKIISNFNIITKEIIETRIKNNDYLLNSILITAGFNQQDNYKFKNIISFENREDGDSIPIQFLMVVNGENFIFDILYNLNSQELLSVSYNLYSEEDYND